MADIPLTNGESYRIGKVNTDPLLTGGSDHAHAPMKIRNGIEITGGARARISVVSNGVTPAAIFSTDPTSIGPSPQGASTALYGGIFSSTHQPTVVSFAGMSGSFADVPNALNDLEYGHLSYVAVGGDGGDLGQEGSISGIGFHCDDAFVKDRVNAVILGRRVQSTAGVNNRTDLLFGTNQALSTNSDTSLFERVRITWDGQLQVKNKDGDTNDYVWINDNGTDGRIGTTREAFDFHVDGGAGSGDAMHIMRIQKTDAGSGANGGIRIISPAELIYDDPNTINSGGTDVLWYSNNKRVGIAGSTRKIKYDIVDIPNNICDNFHKLRPVEFKWKSDRKLSLGFIAEEIAEVDKRFATWGDDREYDENGRGLTIPDPDNPGSQKPKLASDRQVPISINTRTVLAAAVAKIQELEARIKKLESK